MLNVYLCEDNEDQRGFYKKIIHNIILMQDIDLKFVLATDDPYELISKIDSHEPAIYFLDIDLGKDINGLVLAQKIRQVDARGFIVFITSHSEMSYMTFSYKVEAMDFIIKDDRDEIKNRIYQCIMDAYSRYSSPNNINNKVFKYSVGEREYCVPIEDIMYFETSDSPHKIILHGECCEVEFVGTMRELETNLGDRFCKIHRSFLINKDKISEIDVKEKYVVLQDGSVCFASAKALKKLI